MTGVKAVHAGSACFKTVPSKMTYKGSSSMGPSSANSEFETKQTCRIKVSELKALANSNQTSK